MSQECTKDCEHLKYTRTWATWAECKKYGAELCWSAGFGGNPLKCQECANPPPKPPPKAPVRHEIVFVPKK